MIEFQKCFIYTTMIYIYIYIYIYTYIYIYIYVYIYIHRVQFVKKAEVGGGAFENFFSLSLGGR